MKQALYVIADTACGPAKIGIAGDPKVRLADLQVGNHRRLRLWATRGCDQAAQWEKRVHEAFSHRRLSGEWFDATVFEVISAIDTLMTRGPLNDNAEAEEILARRRAGLAARMKRYRAGLKRRKGAP